MPYHLYLVEDHPVVREAYACLLDGEQDLTLCGQAETAEAALEALAVRPCDLVVTDVRLPGMSGIDLLRRIRQRWPRLPVLVLTAQEDFLTQHRAAAEGASGFLHKSQVPAHLLDTIRSVLAASRSSA